MKIVYIAHPISGSVEFNLMSIRNIVRTINIMEPDIIPFVPYYADVVSMDDSDPVQRARGIKNDHAILTSGIVDELWFYRRISEGVKAEIEIAKQMGIPVIDKRI